MCEGVKKEKNKKVKVVFADLLRLYFFLKSKSSFCILFSKK